MNAKTISIFTALIVTAALSISALEPSDVGATKVDPIAVRCPASINVGAKTVPDGWSDAFAIRNELFSGSAVNAGAALMICEYGNFSLHKSFPKGYRCEVKVSPRDFACAAAKPPPIKIPGKKGTS